MTAIHLHYTSDVGTTYKRALERFHQSRDGKVPRDFNTLRLIDTGDNWSVVITQDEDRLMRKPRDFDAELRALGDKTKQLKGRKVHQLGELVIATGADALPVEQLAGLLLAGAESKDANAKESWRKRGAAFFQRSAGGDANGGGGNASGAAASDGGPAPARRQARPD